MMNKNPSIGNLSFLFYPIKNEGRLFIETINEKQYYVWGLWSYIGDTESASHAPIYHGTATSREELIAIADYYFIDITYIKTISDIGLRYYCINNPIQQVIKNLIDDNNLLISIQKKSDKFDLAIWRSKVDFLINIPPLCFERNIDKKEQKRLIAKFRRKYPIDREAIMYFAIFGYSSNSSYLKEHIRKITADKRQSKKTEKNELNLVEYGYSTLDMSNYLKSPKRTVLWVKHRIIKKTEKCIYFEKFPVKNLSHLDFDWQRNIIHTAVVNREEYEKMGFAYSSYTLFCDEQYLKIVHKGIKKLADQWQSEEIYEFPTNKSEWALKVLGLTIPNPTKEQIKQAFNKKAISSHPDKGGSHIEFIEIALARETLLNLV